MHRNASARSLEYVPLLAFAGVLLDLQSLQKLAEGARMSQACEGIAYVLRFT